MKWKITLAFLLFVFFCNGQEINLRVGGTNYLTGSTYSSFSAASGTTSAAITFTIQNTLNASTLNLVGPPIVDIDGPDAAMFVVNETGTASTLTNVSSTTFTISFSPTSPGVKTAYFTIQSNDADEGSYIVNLSGISTVSNASAIIVTPSYAYPTNISYQNYQASNITNGANDIEVGSFTLRDGGTTNDADNLPTTLTDITFSLSNSSNIRSVALYDGTTEIGSDEDGASTVTFNGLNLTAPDNGTKTFTIRVSYNEVVTDGAIPQFIVTSATSLATGSIFTYGHAGTGSSTNTAARTSSTSPNNRIEVIASRLEFLQGPTDTDTFVAMSPSVTVHAVDALGNRDINYTASITLATTGTFNTAAAPVNVPTRTPSSGIATFATVVHSIAGNGLHLTATSGSLGTDVSNDFDIGPASAANNYFRSRATGDWNTASNWETSHNNIDAWVTSSLVPTSSSRGIRILSGHTITCSTTANADQMVVDLGGTFLLSTGANFTLNNGTATDLTVRGTFTYNGGTLIKTGTIEVGSTGVYNHAIVSPTLTLPVISWNAASVCNITGLNNASPIVATNMNQTFGILNWNNPNQAAYVAINDAAFRIAGTLNVGTTTANANNIICLTDSGSFTNAIKTININGGKLIAARGTGSSTITVTGTTTIDGGELIGSQGSGSTTINTNSSLNINSGRFILINHASSGNVNFTITAARDLNISGTGQLFLENVSSPAGVATMTINRNFISTSTATPAIDFGTGIVTDNAIDIKGNFTKSNNGTFTTSSSNAAKGFIFSKAGTQTFTYSGTDSSSVSYTVNSGATLSMSSNLTFLSGSGAESIFTVLNGGRVNFTTRVITGNATGSRVIFETNSTLSSTHTGGIGGVGTLGTFQGFANVNLTPATGRVSLPAGIHYILGGSTTTPFPVGSGIAFGNPATLTTTANITSNMTSALTVTSAFNVNSNTFKLNTTGNNLILNNAVLNITGTFDNNGENQVIGSGSPSVNIIGKFITRDEQGFVGTGTSIPSISPIMGASSTIEYALTGNQVVQGSPAYRNLILSGSGTKTLDSNTTVAAKITVGGSATFDVQSFSAGGTGTALTMTGTTAYRTSGTGIKPDATGIYTLGSNSKIEFYGSQPIEIRLGSPAISYGRIEINGTDVSNNSTTDGILFVSTNSSFTVKSGAVFKFRNTDGFTGSTSTAISNSILVNPILEATSVVEYAGANQTITPYNNSTNNSYKRVTISGSGTKTLTTDPIFIRDNLTVTSSLLRVDADKSLTVTNGITTVNTTSANGISIRNNGSLVQVTAVDNASANNNTGTIDVERITPGMYRYDFTYWGSPVKDYAMNTLSPITLFDKYMSWNASAGTWTIHTYGTEIMAPGKGYAIRAPQNFSTDPNIKTPYEGHFIGVPNNGNVIVPTHGNGSSSPEKFNFLGNPYPSAIDIEKFLLANSTKLQGTVYLWTHSTPLTDSQYNASDYAVYNFSGPTTPYPLGGSGGATKYLAAGQGFLVKGISAGASTVTFTNAMREAGNNNNFFRSAPEEDSETTGKHRIWLNISNNQQAFNQILVGYIQNATDGFDWGYDGEQFGGTQLKFYSLLEDKILTVQGKALPFDTADEVPLGYKSTIAGNLQISIDHYDGLFEGQGIYLEDKLLDVVHDLKESAYNFTSIVGTVDDRFVLRYVPAETLALPDDENIASGVIVYKSNNQIIVKSQLEDLESISVYDLLGRHLFDGKNIGSDSYSIADLVLNEQPLIVKTALANGQIVNRKIIY